MHFTTLSALLASALAVFALPAPMMPEALNSRDLDLLQARSLDLAARDMALARRQWGLPAGGFGFNGGLGFSNGGFGVGGNAGFGTGGFGVGGNAGFGWGAGGSG